MPPISASDSGHRELTILFPSIQNLFTLLVDLGVESRAIVHNYRLFHHEIFVLEVSPILVKQPEPPLDRQHVLHGHAELEVLDEEANLVGAIEGKLALA